MQNDLNWNEHIHGKGGIIPSLNRRLFTIKRLNNSLNKTSLIKVAESLFNSKIRYGLQLLGKVQMSNSESQNQDLQWGSEILTCPVFEWSEVGRL